MKWAGWGRIVNISGGSGRAPGTQISGGARNSATVNMTKALANALGPSGINVNAIYPGGTLTEVTLARTAEPGGQHWHVSRGGAAAAGRPDADPHLVIAEDVANVAAFLCSPLAVGGRGRRGRGGNRRRVRAVARRRNL